MIPDRLIKQTEGRYQEREQPRNDTEARFQAGATPLTLDTPERVEKYLRRHGLSSVSEALPGIAAGEKPATVETSRLPQTERLLYERVLGTSQLMSVRFLERGARNARAVGRVRIRDASGETVGFGTGTLVSPRLLLTNNHVLESAVIAGSSWVEFGYQETSPGRLLAPIPFELDPGAFYETSQELDFTVVAVRETGLDGTPLSRFGQVRLLEEEGKVLLRQTLNIVQHPNGEPKQVAIRENELTDILDNFLHYKTDTAPGSSGSLVCNDEWDVVALHHSGVPEPHPAGGYMAVDGSQWVSTMGEHRLKWMANEGIRISRILKDLKARPLVPAKRALLNEIFSPPPTPRSGGDVEKATKPPISVPPSTVIAEAGPCGALQVTVSVSLPWAAGSGAPPVHRVDISGPGPSAGLGVPTGTTGRQGELDQALSDLAEAKKLPYYSQKQDEEDAASYYAELDLSLGAEKRFKALSALVQSTHASLLKYQPIRQVYPWVDVHPDLKLRSIYSGQEFDPEEIIREDFRILGERMSQAESALRTREGTFTEAQLLREIDLLEASLPYNCEHVVPQSWFGKKEPMRGDLHHLFTCESGCNSFRGNTPYFEFNDLEEAVRDECGKRESTRFEPGAGKGAVARATLYFLLRYPGEINEVATEYTEDRLAILIAWHADNPVSKWERHRNSVIFRKQGNRNPLIDHPEWAERLDFTTGLG